MFCILTPCRKATPQVRTLEAYLYDGQSQRHPHDWNKQSPQKLKDLLQENRLKKAALLATICSLLGAWILYMLWAARIGMRTVLMASIPEWTTYITAGFVIGLIFAAKAFYARPAQRKPTQAVDPFFGGFCLGLACSINIYAVCVYLLPGDIIHYESAYEITYPGPSAGKFSRCEAGLRIKDINTGRWIELCTNQSDLDKQRQRGMNAVWVTARANKVGSYIIGYQFIFK